MTHYFTTAKNLVERKLQYNKLIVDLLYIESNILTREIIIRQKIASNHANKINNINKIIRLETEQLNNYDLSKEGEILNLTNIVNDSKNDVGILTKEIADLKKDILDLSEKIVKLGETIPEKITITNVKIVAPNLGENCR